MSWPKLTRYVRRLRGVTPQEKLCCFVVADYYNPDEGSSWPSVERIAEDMGNSERTTQYILEALETPRDGHENGIIVRRRRDGGRYATNEYVFVEMADEIRARGATRGATRGAMKSAHALDSKEHSQQKSFKGLRDIPPLTPPFQGGNFDRIDLTSRDRRNLNNRIYFLQERDPRLDFETAFEQACAQLALPTCQALDMITGTGLEECFSARKLELLKKKRPQRVAG